MPSTLPRTVREVLGEQASGDLSAWFDESIRTQTVPRSEYREVLSRLDVVDQRFEQVDQRFEQVDQRFEQVDQRFGTIENRLGHVENEMSTMRSEMNQRFDAMNERFDAMGAQFDGRLDAMNERFDRMHEAMRVQTRWTIGTIALFGTIVTVLLAIAQFIA